MYKVKNILMPERDFLRRAAAIGLPIILQNFIMFALNMMDVVLLQGLGDTAVASVSMANQANLVVNLIIFGVSSGCSILVAQYRGGGEYFLMRKTICTGLAIIGIITVIAESMIAIFPQGVMRIMTNEPQLIEMGARYLRIAAFSFVFSGISMVYSTLLRCNERTKLPLIASVTALSINTLLNYLLIYGIAGMPKLGATGAAVATVISRIIELCIIVSFVYTSEKRIRPVLKDFFRKAEGFSGRFFKIASPVILNEIAWGLGMTVYSTIYGRMGEITVAAMSVANVLEQTFAVVAIGCGSITTIMLGKELGEGSFEKAKHYANTLSVWAVLLGLVTTVIMSLAAPVFAKKVFANLSYEAINLAIALIYMFALYMPVRAFNYTNIVGTLRSGGDSIWAAALDVGPIYLYSIPLGMFLGLYLKLPSVYVIPVMYSEEFIKALLGLVRMRKYKWVRKIG